MKDREYAVVVARIILGINIWAHGVVRVPSLNSFSEWMVGLYKDCILPLPLVQAWSYAVPFIELFLGGLLVVGLFSRNVLLALGGYLAMLVLGSCLIQKWEWAAFQMIYALFVSFLLYNLGYNGFSIDRLLDSRKEIIK